MYKTKGKIWVNIWWYTVEKSSARQMQHRFLKFRGTNEAYLKLSFSSFCQGIVIMYY